jgi:uncharacterized protein (DUF952 family)
MTLIYKICPAPAWREAERNGVYRGSADDLGDGFIHFSTAAQLPGTLRKYFSGQPALFLIAIDPAGLVESLRWEPARDGSLFPHLYGELDLLHVVHVMELPLLHDGSHAIPEL